MHQGHHEGGEAAQAGAYRDQREGEVKAQQRIHLAEQHEADAEHQDAYAEDDARPETIHQPALQGAEDAALDPGQGEGAGQQGLAPAEIPLQHHQIGAVGLHEQGGGQPMQAAAGGDDPPAVKHPPRRTQEVIEASS